jgi:hypothetical protein
MVDIYMNYFWLVRYFALAFLVGGFVGLSELLSRYAWKFGDIVRSGWGLVYLIANGIVATIAYTAALQWGLLPDLAAKAEAWRACVIAILSMAVLRSALFNIKVGDKDVGIGLTAFIEIYLRHAERVLDQRIQNTRWQTISELVDGMSYSGTRNYLFAVAQGVLRSLSHDEVEALRNEVAKIDLLEADDPTKMEIFAMRISEKTGLELFIAFAERAKAIYPIRDTSGARIAAKLQQLAEAKTFLTPKINPK